ncbi:MAG: pantetheine-phosphate adenylyltransferase [Duncaniella sp.]|nr:pantetheine-phosphate adenylyltransferase [Duncaniella sp.]HBI57681.1 pantetheine-phosphate adenylyltransferase [Porphyromonadaceae bacterium]
MTRRFPDADERIALFPGSFNPFTLGHKSLVDRALPLFDKVVIAIGYNSEKCAADDAALTSRLETIRAIYADEPRVEVTSYAGLTVDACRECGARWMLRGVRSVADFEYERTLADVNRRISGIETVILYTLPEYASISSSIVRELGRYGYATGEFLP